MALAHLKSQVHDPALRAALTPDYAIGCKRILISNDFYPALQQPNVRLIAEAAAAVTPEGLVTASGEPVGVDAIVWATGFWPFEVVSDMSVTGREGRDLGAVWGQEGVRTHYGISVAGFPNFFLLMGPNTGLGHTSMVFMIESQIAHVMKALAACEGHGAAAVEPTEDVQTAFYEEMQGRLRQTVWGSGCASWYLAGDGRNFTTWPGFATEYRRRTRRFDLDEHRFVHPQG